MNHFLYQDDADHLHHATPARSESKRPKGAAANAARESKPGFSSYLGNFMSQEGSTMWNTDCHLSKIAEEGKQIKRAMTKGKKKAQVKVQELDDDEKANVHFWLLPE